jgi:uroporphyrinogen III methyltransferase/synthase
LETYDRLVFASPFAVVEFFNALYQLGFDARHLSRIKIASIGSSTSARLKKFGLNIAPESDKNSIEGMINAFKDKKVTWERILLPCSIQGFNELPERLRLLGNEVEEFHLYEIILPDNAVRHNLDEFSGVVFTSPTTIKHFFDFYGEFPKHLKPVFKGEYSQKIFKKMHKERFVS